MRSPRAVLVAIVSLFLAVVGVLGSAQLNRERGTSRHPQLSQTQTVELVPQAQKLTPKFASAVGYATHTYAPESVAVADLNLDGHLDVVVASECVDNQDCAGVVSVFLGKGDGTFQPAVTYSSGGYAATSIAVVDVNGDGKPDVLVANYCADSACKTTGSVGVLLGNGDGTLQPAVEYDSGGYLATSLAVADVNGDGKPDALIAHYCVSPSDCSTGAVGVLLGNGNGGFQTPTVYGSGGISAISVATGDLNDDGHNDIVVINDCETGCGTKASMGGVGVMLGVGDGTFTPVVVYSSGGDDPASVAIGDINGDGRPDIVVANCGATFDSCFGVGAQGYMVVMDGNGDGTFQPGVGYGSGAVSANAVVIADLNGDSKPDLVVGNTCKKNNKSDNCVWPGEVSVLLGDGNGAFQKATIYGSGGNAAVSVQVADLNGDGRPDLVAADEGSAALGVLLNITSYTTKTALSSSPNPSIVNQSVSLTAKISSATTVPDGEVVTFYNGATKVGTGTTASSVAILTTSFSAAGTYTINASYPGDAFHKPSSGKVKQMVKP